MQQPDLAQRLEQLESENRARVLQQLALERRLRGLERASARWRRLATVGLALALVPLAAVVGGWRSVPSVPDEVEASRFVLRGDDGGEAAVLGRDAQGNPSLLLQRGKARAFLTLSGPGLLLRGDDGKRSAFLGFDTRGNTQLSLTSERGADGLRLDVLADGTASLAALDTTGRKRAALGWAASDSTSSLTVHDATGRIRTSLGLEDGQTPALVLLDANGVRRLGALVDPEEQGTPGFAMLDERGRPRVELTTSFDGSPILALRRADGGTSFQAP